MKYHKEGPACGRIPYDSTSSEADCEYPLYWTFICVREYVVKTEMECLSHKKKRRL